MDEAYLGDGLYASHDGYQIVLRAPREGGDHWVALEPSTLMMFLAWLDKQKGTGTYGALLGFVANHRVKTDG